MKSTMSLSIAAVVCLLAVGTASAAERTSTITTNRGAYTVQGSASCADGTCSGSRTTTGPSGYSANRAGSITANGDGSATYSGSRTGPRGRSIQRSGTVTVSPN